MYIIISLSLSLYSILFYIFWIIEMMSSVLCIALFMPGQKKPPHEMYHNDNYRERE